MTDRVCVRKEGHFLRNYSSHVLKRTIDEEGEQQYEGARLGEVVDEHRVEKVRRSTSPRVGVRQFSGWSSASFGVGSHAGGGCVFVSPFQTVKLAQS